MNKKIATFGLVALAGLSLCAGVAVYNGGVSSIRADEVNTWKHFSAVMPTDTSKGIREYWTDCTSQTLLTAPEGVTPTDATLSAEQIATILADSNDFRIIPTLNEISASVAKGYDGSSPYQGSDVECAYAYTYLDETTKAKIGGADETKITAAYNAFKKYYSVLVDINGMDSYANTVTSIASDDTYGNVLKVNSSNDLPGENWTFGPDRKAALTEEGISAIRFMIYAPQPMNVSFINHDCNTWYDASTGQIVHAKKETTMAAGEWKEFTIPTSAIEEMDTFHIALYLSPSPYIGYGIPTVSDSAEKGSAYISEIIGVKEAYYEPLAASLDASIASFGEKTLTMWDGAELKKIRSDYDALPSVAKSLVKNAETLATLEATYAASWACYNYSWVQGQVNKSTTFTSTMGVDDTYGVYTEFLTASDAWIVHWTPDSDTAITKDAKIAVYNPTEGTVAGYYSDNDWGNAAYPSFAPGWSVIDLPAAIFKNSVANGASVGIQIKSITDGGWKFSAIYSE